MSSIREYYLASISDAGLREKYTSSNITIPLKQEGEEVVIDAETDLPDDPSELCALLINEERAPEYWLLVAKAYANQHKWDESLEVIKQALEGSVIETDDKFQQAAFHDFVSWVYLARAGDGSTEDAADLFKFAQTENQQTLSLDPENQNGLLAKSVFLMASKPKNRKSNFEKENHIFDQLLKKHPRNCYALLGKAKIFFYRENYQGALKLFQKVLMLNPLLTPDPRIGIGICFWFLDQKDLATRAWQNSVLVNDTKANIEAKILVALSKFDYSFSKSISDDDFAINYKEALDFTKACYQEAPANHVVQLLLASFYFMKADYDLVAKITDTILNDPGTVPSFVKSDALFWQARSKFVQGDSVAAQRLFTDSFKANDRNILARIGYAQCLVVRHQINDAIRIFEKVSDSRPQNIDIVYALGMLYSKTKHHKTQSIDHLEKYIKLATDQNEPVALSALFTLSRLYEDKDLNKALEYLQTAKDQEIATGKSENEVSYALLNNIGSLTTLFDRDATANFESALASLKNRSELDPELQKAADVTLRYNVARSKEATGNPQDAMELYESILNDSPNYTSARIRYLLLACLSEDRHIKDELDELLSKEPDNMELRSFYGWYLKNYGKRHQLSSDKGRDLESNLHRDTLVKYDSHDLYALVSLANIYSSLAREVKEPKKKDQYYVRATQLYQKVLTLDPRDVYAAQGLAIVFAEKKDSGLALEVFRRARDALNDKAVYINLAHCLLESKQYAKSLENYQYALDKFTDGKDAKLLNLIGRAWLYRGISEKTKVGYEKALEAVRSALEINALTSYKYNIVYVQFQLASFIKKLPPSKRSVKDLEEATQGLEEAIQTLNELAQDTEHNPPYPAEDLKLRAEMGQGLITQLETATKEQKEYEAEISSRLQVARKKHQEEERLEKEIEEKLAEEKRKIEEKMAAERKELEKQQAEWNQSRIEEEKDRKDEIDKAVDGDHDKKPKKGRKKKEEAKKKEKEEFVVSSDEEVEEPVLNDEEEPEAEAEPEAEDEPAAEPEATTEEAEPTAEEADSAKPSRKRKTKAKAKEAKPKRRRTRNVVKDDDDEEDDGLF